ncbi:MAG TPA: RHS repeat-associated core domain-containing protein [Bacteroidia bacterium]|nr:RHS repeat-associated core domain-containing protein [Bacteroidia bacterium]
MGDKQYELANHLGNVMSTISDKKEFELISSSPLIYTWKPEVLSWQDYYPFGMKMSGRIHNRFNYDYSFQNQEQQNELSDYGYSLNFKFRIYESRLGRFISIDPLSSKYPFNSPYAFSENRIIDCIELEGLEKALITKSAIYNTNTKKMDFVTEFKIVTTPY